MKRLKNLMTVSALAMFVFSCSSSDDNSSINSFTTTVDNQRSSTIEYLGFESYTAISSETSCRYALKYHLRNLTDKEATVTVRREGYNVYENGKLNNDKPSTIKETSVTLAANSDGWADEQYTFTGDCVTDSSKPKKLIIR